MPAKDRHQDAVVRALRKDGWAIIREQVELIVPSRRLWIDTRASREVHGAAILIDLKGFDLVASPVAYLSDAIGQCVVYQAALAYLGVAEALYLAVPVTALTGILGEEIGRRAIYQARVGVIAFDPLREEIIEWRHSSTS